MSNQLHLSCAPPDAHAQEVLRNHYTPANGWELTGLQRTILQRLVHRLGQSQAMPLKDLQLITGESDRNIKEAIRGLVVDFRVRIGASRGEVNGYYLITSREEALATAQPYISEVRQLVRRIRVLLDPHDLAELAGQLRLDADEPKEAA